ncbi:MAG: hypothetical protein Salg2KO_00540 [Salibacteraceae bacterium]
MTLRDRYASFSNEKLMAIADSPEGDYRPDAKNLAHQILIGRGLDVPQINRLARQLMMERIWNYLDQFDVVNDTFVLPVSKYLNETEVKSIFTETFTRWKHEQDDMIPDGWQYVLAAGLG